MTNYTKIITTLSIVTAMFCFTSCDKSVLEEPLAPASPYKVLEDETTLISSRNVQFVTNQIGYAVGDAGKIIKTSDGGVNWDEQVANATTAFWGVYFINEKVGWITGAGGVIKNTTDGGLTWNDQVSGLTLATDIIYSVHFRDANNGICAATGSNLLITADGGKTWKITKPLKRTVVLRNAKFVDEKNIYIVGASGILLRSKDAAATWDTTAIITNGLVTNGITATQTMTSLQFPSKNIGYVSGGSGWVAKIDVAKNTATLINPPVAEAMAGLYFFDENTGLVAGNFGLIYKTKDGGVTWDKLKSGTGSTLTAIYYPSPEIGYIVGSKVILKSK